MTTEQYQIGYEEGYQEGWNAAIGETPPYTAPSAAPEAIAKLRHLYKNLMCNGVRSTEDAKRIAQGLLAPAIEALERITPPAEKQAAPKVEPVSSDTLYLLRRLLSNQHTLTGPEFRAELEKIVGEAYQQEAQPVAIVVECGNLYAKVKLSGEAFGTTKVGDGLYRIPTAPVPPSDDVVREPLPFSSRQRERLFNNRPVNVGKGLALADWHRVVEFIEAAHGITQKGGQHGTE